MIRNVLLSAALTALAFTGALSYGFVTGRICMQGQTYAGSGDYLEEIASVTPTHKRGK